MQNGVMLQSFEWYEKNDGSFYRELKERIPELKELGFDSIWLPPAFKGNAGVDDVGYGIYDLYDLGEFDQKGTIRTKYGTKEEYLDLIDTIHEYGMKAYADVVLNHKAGADYTETFKAVKVNDQNRLEDISGEIEIEGWTGFNFPGRNNKYSDFIWYFNHFSGVDYDQKTGEKGVYRIIGQGKYWDQAVSSERGNFDYLMFADIDHKHKDVIEELFSWNDWYLETTKLDGYRFDALKHINYDFIDALAERNIDKYGQDFFMIGEYWQNDLAELDHYLYETDYNIHLFDVPLHFNLYNLSRDSESFDLRRLYDNTIISDKPENSVSFVDNHDSQPGQSLESFVEDWAKEIAYSIILLRKDGYPCVFAGDYYGIKGENPIAGKKDMIDRLLVLRRDYAYGEERDYFPSKDLMGFVRYGDRDHKNKLAVIISTGDMKTLNMYVGEEEAGKTYVEYYTGKEDNKIKIKEDGTGDFTVGPGRVACYIEEES